MTLKRKESKQMPPKGIKNITSFSLVDKETGKTVFTGNLSDITIVNTATIREQIKVGNIVEYKGKKYIVILKDYLCGGNVMEVDIIRLTDSFSRFKIVKCLYDEEIEDLWIIN
jgi:hypothetical protein